MDIRGFYVVVTAFLWNFLLQKDVGILPDICKNNFKGEKQYE